jgi:NADPH:quinone reductase-like Zn-dependent oxidoreductase
MRAYVLKHYGGPEGSLLMDAPPPAPGPRDILVSVRAAGLNPVDFKFRQGKLRAILRPTLPFILGNEFAGEVIAVGRDVKRSARVTGCLPGSRRTVRAHSLSRLASTRITLRICPGIWISRPPPLCHWRR